MACCCGVTPRRLAPLLLLLPLLSCDDAAVEAECEPGDGPTSLSVDNRSGGLVSTITAIACDGGEKHLLSVPEGGIPFSEQASLELPGPGCWELHWTGEGCKNDPPYRTTTEVCPGDTYAWTITTEGRTCDPGGW